MGCLFSSDETISGMNYKIKSALPCNKRDQLYRINDYVGPTDPSNTSNAIQQAFLSLPEIQERQLTCMCDLISVPHVTPSPSKHCSMRKLSAVGSLNNFISEAEFRVICNGSLNENSDYFRECNRILSLKVGSQPVFNSRALNGVIFFVFQERFDCDKWSTEKIILSKSGSRGNELSTTIRDSNYDIVICGYKPTRGGQKGSSIHNRVALLSMLYERTAKRDQFNGSLKLAADITNESCKFIECIHTIKNFLDTDIITKLWTDNQTSQEVTFAKTNWKCGKLN